jgi:hypothetical protein
MLSASARSGARRAAAEARARGAPTAAAATTVVTNRKQLRVPYAHAAGVDAIDVAMEEARVFRAPLRCCHARNTAHMHLLLKAHRCDARTAHALHPQALRAPRGAPLLEGLEGRCSEQGWEILSNGDDGRDRLRAAASHAIQRGDLARRAHARARVHATAPLACACARVQMHRAAA